MTIEDLRMRPDQQRPIYEERGKTFVNTYSPPTHDAEGGAIDVGIEFLAHLLPIAIEREWFTKWLAFKFRHPAIPGPAVVMVASNQFGTGRGTLAKILERLFGQRYVKSMPFANLVGSTYQSQYNDFLAEALIAVTNESSDVAGSGRYANSMNNYERIKEIVDPAPRMVRFNRKGLSNFDGLSFTTFLIATNHQDALPVPANDRRFAVLSNGQPMTDESKSKVHEWIASDANIAAFANHLNSIDISDYNPFADPIMTDAKRAMADMARSDLDRAASEVINSTLCGEVFTVDQIIRRLETWRLTTTNCDFPDRWSIIARKIIERTCIRVGIRHGVNWVTTINGKRHPVYAVSQNLARKWTQSTVLREEVLKNDFYVPSDIVPFPRLVQP